MDNDDKDLKDVEGGVAAASDAALLQVAELQRSSSYGEGKDDNLKAPDEHRRSHKVSRTNTLEARRNALENSVSAYQFTHSCTSPSLSNSEDNVRHRSFSQSGILKFQLNGENT